MLPSRFHGIATAALLCAFPLLAVETAPPTAPELPPTRALSPQDEAKTFQLPPGYHVELVLSEPEIKEPVITAFDGNGRMYVAEMRSYMQEIDGKNELDPVSRVSLHWSSKNDGHYDKHTVFADKLVLPRMILPLDDRRVVIGETNTSDLYLYTDTKGVGVADKKELWFQGGPRGGNLEHQPNGLLWSIDNCCYSTYNAYRLRWTPQGVVSEPTGHNNGQWGIGQDNHGHIYFVNAGGEAGPQSFQVPVVYGGFNPRTQFETGFPGSIPAANACRRAGRREPLSSGRWHAQSRHLQRRDRSLSRRPPPRGTARQPLLRRARGPSRAAREDHVEGWPDHAEQSLSGAEVRVLALDRPALSAR